MRAFPSWATRIACIASITYGSASIELVPYRTNEPRACASLAPVISARAPCPRRQLLTYVAFTAGRRAVPTIVHARDAAIGQGWRRVGSIAAGTQDATDESLETLTRAVQLQRRLIAEHACRLYPELRDAKRRDGKHGIELGVEHPTNEAAAAILPVPPSELGDVPSAQMLGCGFAGAALSAGTRPPARGIYHEFERQGSPEYDRRKVVERLAKLIGAHEEPTAETEDSPAFTLVAWPHCGFCTKARAELDARGIPYKHVVIDKFSAEHAELAMSTGRCSVPYVFDRSGTLLGGYEREGDALGLIGALAALGDGPTARGL